MAHNAEPEAVDLLLEVQFDMAALTHTCFRLLQWLAHWLSHQIGAEESSLKAEISSACLAAGRAAAAVGTVCGRGKLSAHVPVPRVHHSIPAAA